MSAETEALVESVSPSIRLAAVAIVKGISDPDELREALERVRVVAVLDAWAIAGLDSLREWRCIYDSEASEAFWMCELCFGGSGKHFTGSTPDAARAAAAKAIESGGV